MYYVLMTDEKGKNVWIKSADPTIWGKPGSSKVYNKKMCVIVAIFEEDENG